MMGDGLVVVQAGPGLACVAAAVLLRHSNQVEEEEVEGSEGKGRENGE